MLKTNLKQKIDSKKLLRYSNYAYAALFAIILILGIIDQTGIMLAKSTFIGSFSVFTFTAFIMLLVYIIFIFGYFIKKKLGIQDEKAEAEEEKNKAEEVSVKKIETVEAKEPAKKSITKTKK